MSRGVKAGGIGGLGLLVVVILAMLLGVDPQQLLQDVEVAQVPSSASVDSQPQSGSAGDELADFVSVVLADTEDTWNQLLARHGRRYQEPVLVLFKDQVGSACGFASAASGPFYCPADHKVYLDLVFFDELRSRFRAPGDCAQAYVIAHEVGHHVQNLLGIMSEVYGRQQRLSKAQANELSVRLELQADCFAGVWAHHAQRVRNLLEQGDLEEALSAASAVGDDRIQRQSQGYIVPDSFTHGTSRQRMQWFANGYESGDFLRCDTFNTSLNH
jgi:predicted metalloprotease